MTIRHGKGGEGGGIRSSGVLTITNAVLINNWGTIGGGISSRDGELTITNSTISGNSAQDDGGGIRFHHDGDGALTITNSTISGNTAGSPNDNGGGIHSSGTVTIINTTITNNTASKGGGISIFSGTVEIRNTIIAGNPHNGGADCSGSFTSLGHNLIGDIRDCNFTVATGDRVGTVDIAIDPKLGPLQDNRGRTFTHALLPNSPAVDAGNPAAPGSSGNACEAADQRGVARPVDGNGDGTARCDIGAYELEPNSLPMAFGQTVSTTGDRPVSHYSHRF